MDTLEHQTAATHPSVEEAEAPRFSPSQALWNQREKLASLRPRIEQLHAAVASPEEMSLYQWAQLTAAVLEFQPDLIIELGRRAGNSTTCFLEAANQLGSGRCKVVSVCLDPMWHEATAPKLSKIVAPDWFDAGHIVRENILTFNFSAALGASKRCLVFWDAHGFEVAECVLGGLLPLLRPRQHLVIMHDLSDLRYISADPNYGADGIWKDGGDDTKQPPLWLGWIFSQVPQAISILDFSTRNNLPLYSADESINEELVNDPGKAARLELLLGAELASPQAHWFWFTLNGAQQNLTFPYFSPEASLQRFELMADFNSLHDSIGWRLFKRFRKLARLMFPAGSLRKRVYEYCVRPLRKRISQRRHAVGA